MNCTSRRAVKEDKPVIKLSFLDKRIFLIHSIPVEIKNRKYSIELIQDVSSSFLLHENNLQGADEVLSLISLFDERIMKDSSTNLFNKQYLLENLSAMMAHAKSESRPLSLAVLDVDHFKRTNDRYGHVFGDEVILKISETLIALMNESIHAVRIGGDEFALYLKILIRQRRCQSVIRRSICWPLSTLNRIRNIGLRLAVGLRICAKVTRQNPFWIAQTA